MITLKRALYLLICLSFFYNHAGAQQLTWANKYGGNATDQGSGLYLDNAGNVITGGKFSGTNIDFDPSGATAYLSSAGATDAFVAKYDATGKHIFSFRIGGSNLDEINDLTVDLNDNIYITGFFRGSNVDFDPGPGSTLLSSNGDGGGDPGYGGDIFIAKYSPTGAFIWARGIGGFTIGDNGIVIRTDDAGNVYLGGYFQESVDFDPGPGIKILDGSDGTAFLARFDTNGLFNWAFNFGNGDDNNSMFDLVLDGVGNFYATGYFKGVNIDFDPGPGQALLNASGQYEMFVSKYTTDGEYVNAFSVGGSAHDVGRSIVLDAQKNIYVLGDFASTNVDFDPGPGVSLLSTKGQGDVFLAKYTSTGAYQWAFGFGGGGNDFGWKIASDGLHLFITGGFNGTSDLNGLAGISDNLTSSGGNDIFMGKYTLDGEYLCAFKIGGAADDVGFSIRVAGVNTFYMTGGFNDGNVDFDPTSNTYPLSSAGRDDIFLAKYFWPDDAKPAGTLSGTGVCGNTPARLTFTSTAGVGPFTIRITDGVDVYDQANVESGIPFEIMPQPTTTTTYGFVYIADAQKCSELTYMQGHTVFIPVNPEKVVARNDTAVCFNSVVQLQATGSTNYSWSPAAGLSDPQIDNPVLNAVANTRYYVTSVSAEGCVTRDSVDLEVYPELRLKVTEDTMVCTNSILGLSVANAQIYTWSPAAGLDDPTSNSPVYTATTPVEFYVTGIDVNGCKAIDSVEVGLYALPVVEATDNFSTCYKEKVQLQVNGAQSYSWSPAAGLSNSTLDNPVVYPENDIKYVVTGVGAHGCASRDSVLIDVFDIPVMTLTDDEEVCNDTPVQLEATGGVSYQWSPVLTLEDPNIGNPVAHPTGNTKYYVETTDQNSCRYLDSVSIDVRPVPIFTIIKNKTLCRGDSIHLWSSGGDLYHWTPAVSLSNSSAAEPFAFPEVTTTYTVIAGESVCNNDSILTTKITVVPLPMVDATKSNDVDCSTGFSHLSASGAVQYSWSPDSSLSNGLVRNPVASPSTTTQYVVTGTALSGCHSTDTIVVSFNSVNKSGYLMANAFTPNSDGINDCFGIGYWGLIGKVEFSVFNRWGQLVFYSEDPQACWDGKIKGVPQGAGVFVYMVKASTICEPSVFRKGTFVLIR